MLSTTGVARGVGNALGHGFGGGRFGAAALAAQALPFRSLSPEPGDDAEEFDPKAWDFEAFNKTSPGERVRFLEYKIEENRKTMQKMEGTLASLAEGTTPFQKAQQKELGDLRRVVDSVVAGTTPYQAGQKEKLDKMERDVHTLTLWRHAVLSCGAVATFALGLATAYTRFFA